MIQKAYDIMVILTPQLRSPVAVSKLISISRPSVQFQDSMVVWKRNSTPKRGLVYSSQRTHKLTNFYSEILAVCSLFQKVKNTQK
jgi:hypothetical protein